MSRSHCTPPRHGVPAWSRSLICPFRAHRAQTIEVAQSTVSPQWEDIKVARQSLIQRWDRRHSSEPPSDTRGRGDTDVSPVSAWAGRERVRMDRRGGVYGSPFFDDGRGGSPAEAYRQWLTGSRTAGELGRAHAVGVHKPWRLGLHSLEGRLTALLRLVSRVRRGERLQLSCACQEHVLDSCHGDVIVDWVRGRVRPV